MTFATGALRSLLPLAILTILGVAVVPLTSGTPGGGDVPGQTEFRAFMEPRLVALLESSRAVNDMVSERSRNILALRSESSHIEGLVEEIDGYLAETEIPGWAQPVVDDYRTGSQHLQTAIDAAFEAIRTFDFSKMTEMVPVFGEGTRLIEQSLDTLRASDM